MRQFQLATENNLTSLKKNVLGLEVKYSEVVSQKYNL